MWRVSFLLLCVAVTAMVAGGCSPQAGSGDSGAGSDAPAVTADRADTAEPSTQTAVADNQNCPIMGGEVSADAGTVSWNGKTIGFCCEPCIEKWNRLSDDDKAAKLAEANPEQPSGAAAEEPAPAADRASS